MLSLFGYALLGGLFLGAVEVSIALHSELKRRHAERERERDRHQETE